MAERTWYPYAADQQFGHQAAADAELADVLLAVLEAARRPTPRAANKAEIGDRRGPPAALLARMPFASEVPVPLAAVLEYT